MKRRLSLGINFLDAIFLQWCFILLLYDEGGYYL